MKEKVIEILQELSGLQYIDETATLQDELLLDSLSMVTLLVELEDNLGFQLDESDMDPFRLLVVSDVIALVEKYIGDTYE